MIEEGFIERAKSWALEEPEYYIHRQYDKRRKKPEKYKGFRKAYEISEKGQRTSKRRNAIRQRRFRELVKDHTHEQLEEIRDFYCRCPKGYHVDHIIPISKGGTHTLDNLQYLSATENFQKGAKLNWVGKMKGNI